MQLPQDVHPLRIPIPGDAMVPDNTLGYTLSYLVRVADGWGLVDTGWNADTSFSALCGQMEELKVSLKEIRWLLVTHFHPDHLGLAGRIKDISGARLTMHAYDAPAVLLKRIEGAGGAFGDRLQRWLRGQGMPDDESAGVPFARSELKTFITGVQVDVAAEADLSFGPGEVVWTPGHTAGHLCLYDRERRLLFSGDHILQHITANISLFPMGPDNPLGDYFSSLRRLESLDVDWVMPGHGWPFQGFKERLSEIRRHHTRRLEETMGALRGGPKTAYEVAERVKWDPGPWDEMTAGNRTMALFETLAHLRYLVKQHLVKELGPEGQVVYGLDRQGSASASWPGTPVE